MRATHAPRQRHLTHDGGLLAIAVFKLAKAALLLVAGFGALRLVRGDAVATVVHWLDELSVGTDHRIVHRLLVWVSGVSPRRLHELGAAAFVYAAALTTEGVGLLLARPWAEYLTVVLTASLIPFELYELTRRATPLRALTLVVNAAAVAYLVYVLTKNRKAREAGRGTR